MKAEKVLGIVACAFACASSSVFANTTSNWFGVVASDVVVATNNATVVGTIEKIEASKIFIDNDKDSAYTVTPSVATPALNDGLVTITSSAILTPSEVSDLDLVGAQAGFAVGVSNNGAATNFYGFASAATNGLPAWIQLSGTPSAPETPTQFKIVLDYRTSTVQFYQGDDLLSGNINEVPTTSFAISNNFVNLSSVAAYGSGAITSIESKYEVAVAAVVTDNGATTNLYGSAAEAVIAAGQNGEVKEIDADGDAVESKSAANGLATWECEVLGIASDDKDAKIPLAPADEAVAGKITLKFDGSVASGVEAKFKVQKVGDDVGSVEYPAAAIQIPMEMGTYKVVPVIKAAQ